MPKLPTKLIVFVVVGGFLWIFAAPKRAEFAARILRNKRMGNLEDSIHVLVEEKIRKDVCSYADLCEYRPHSWEGFHQPDPKSASIQHTFFTDGRMRKCLFRIRGGKVSELIDMR